MKKFHPIIIILLIFFLYLIISHFLFPLENLDTNTTANQSSSFSIDDAITESNTFIYNSSDEISKRQRIVDRINHIFTENDSDLIIRSHKRTTPPPPSPPEPQPLIIVESAPKTENSNTKINIQDDNKNNLNFEYGLENWKDIYFPGDIIGPNGVLNPPPVTIWTKSGKDDYGFTFQNKYVQLEFTNFSQYNFNPYNYKDPSNITPFVCLQTNLILNPGTYQLKYNIQTRPNISWNVDSRTIGIMSMVNTVDASFSSPIFLFRKLVNKKPVPFLTDETKLTSQTLNFTISEGQPKYATFTFIFVVTDTTLTNNCTVAFGDIQILNCAHNAC